ncbi:MAG TPA: hypothetical protein VKA14_00105 [Gammaproteobacteria bacterium]|nr:hypothetical protein [Gammaproteobacteria bacterium]
MVTLIVVLFLLAAGGGLWLARKAARRERVSTPVALGHAAVAVLALGLLTQRVVSGPKVLLLNDALLLFVFAALGGLLLLVFRLDREPPPMMVIFLHGLVAAIGLSVLVTGYVGL